MQKPRISGNFRKACLIVAKHCYGAKGVWAYATFAFINRKYFGNRLPWPHIIWGLTAHGACLAWASSARDRSRPPVILLHPALLKKMEKENPWQIPTAWLGPSLVFDALLHECMHVHIEYNLGGQDGRSSHDCRRWVRQVNRLARELGYAGVRAGGTKTVRVPDHSAPRTVRGKVATKVVRTTDSNIPYPAVTGFPMALRRHMGDADEYYSCRKLPRGAPKLETFTPKFAE